MGEITERECELYCHECGKTESEQAIVPHYDLNWCLDCMRQSCHCISCNVYLPEVVEDIFFYESDQCPECNKNEEL